MHVPYTAACGQSVNQGEDMNGTDRAHVDDDGQNDGAEDEAEIHVHDG